MHGLKTQQGRRFLAARRGMRRSAVVELSREIAEHVISSPFFRAAGAALLYSATDNEVETDAVRTAGHASGKLGYYGRALRRTGGLEFVRVSPGEALHRGVLGTYEPTDDEVFRPGQPALVIVPGVAFDLSGARLGRGRGYYDRTLRRRRPLADILGLAFDIQLTSSLPRAAHDEPVDFVATELGVLCCSEACYPRMPDGPDKGVVWESGWSS